ncbi:MAG: aldehyde dehydrogenase family protein [Bdellovibrionaceae bacterium]|nr:aldehyde dehydrogenase family protein [Pseudobdellovibrionaceae bacterium]
MTTFSSLITKLNPFTHDVLYTHPKSSIIDLVKTIQAANKAFSEWKTSSIAERLSFLEKITAQYILKKDEIILSEALDQGLCLSFTARANYEMGLHLLNSFKQEMTHQNDHADPRKIFFANGVVAVILSWNLSNRLFIQKAISALMAGNTVIVKVSSHAISTAVKWKEILHASGMTEELIQFVVSDAADFKKLLVSHPGIKAITVAGSLATSAAILKTQSETAEQQFKKIQLNSGTKNSCVVLDAPNEDLVNEVLETFLIGQGQLAWNSSRLFILEKFQKEWIETLQNKLNTLKPASTVEDASLWGPIVKTANIEKYAYYQKQAIDDQAKLIRSKGEIKPGFAAPFFTYDMSNCSELQQDQLNLPIFVLSDVKYGFDVPKYSNVSYYGHSANIFSQNAPSEKIVNQLDVGLVSLNKWSVYQMISFKAVKQSSFGVQDSQIFGEFNSNVKILS